MPSGPGVYLYTNKTGRIIYVGKAKNLRRRVASYFRPEYALGPKTSRLMSEVNQISHIEVESELEAYLLESKLIKKYQPFFNLIDKDDKSPYYIHITHDEFPKPIINHDPYKAITGPFLSGLVPKRILLFLRHITPFCTANKNQKGVCSYYHIGLCRPCPHSYDFSENDAQNYRQNIKRLKSLLSGNFNKIALDLKREMNLNTQNQNFEQSAIIRDQMKYLENLKFQPLLPETYIENPNLEEEKGLKAQNELLSALNLSNSGHSYRIETYDNSHLRGQNASSAMVVAVNGKLRPDLYRHFKIKFKGDDDVSMMKEVLTRRLNRTDWGLPDLIVLDGGKSQLSIIHNTLYVIPIIALSKRHEIITIPITDGFRELVLPRNNSGLRLLQNLRDEAHRFSRRLHHKLRKRNLLA